MELDPGHPFSAVDCSGHYSGYRRCKNIGETEAGKNCLRKYMVTERLFALFSAESLFNIYLSAVGKACQWVKVSCIITTEIPGKRVLMEARITMLLEVSEGEIGCES